MSNYDPTSPQQPGSGPQPPSYGPPPPAGSGPGMPPPPPAPGGGEWSGAQMPAYGQMPGGSYTPPPPPVRPKSIDLAVKLMQAGGVLALVNLLTVFLFKDQIREAAEESAAKSGQANVDIDTIVSVSIAFAVIFGLLGALLWFWMASSNGKGKSWARIVASVFYGLSLLSLVASFMQAQPMLGRLLSLVSLAIGTGAMLMMWKKESTDYYNAVSRRP